MSSHKAPTNLPISSTTSAGMLVTPHNAKHDAMTDHVNMLSSSSNVVGADFASDCSDVDASIPSSAACASDVRSVSNSSAAVISNQYSIGSMAIEILEDYVPPIPLDSKQHIRAKAAASSDFGAHWLTDSGRLPILFDNHVPFPPVDEVRDITLAKPVDTPPTMILVPIAHCDFYITVGIAILIWFLY